jgi:hypothetical protein
VRAPLEIERGLLLVLLPLGELLGLSRALLAALARLLGSVLGLLLDLRDRRAAALGPHLLQLGGGVGVAADAGHRPGGLARSTGARRPRRIVRLRAPEHVED